jgi:predicted permease
MEWFSQLGRRLLMLFRRRQFDADLDEEMRLHRELREREQIERGLSPMEAHYAVQRRFGSDLVLREESRDVWGWNWLENLVRDVRYGFRMLVKNPGFTAVAVLTLALGVGTNTAMFSVVNGVLLNPLPYWQPDRLVALYRRDVDFSRTTIPYISFLDWADKNHSFSALAAFESCDFNLTGAGEPERVSGQMVSASFFPLLGIQPILGRGFLPEEDRLGAQPVALISESLWKRRYGVLPQVLGKAVTLDGRSYTIIGVIPASFRFRASSLYVPIGQWDEPGFRERGWIEGMLALGRLKPGVTFAQANADMESVARHLAERYPETDKGTGITLVPLKQDMVGYVKPTLLLLLAAVGFVLLIACVNVANLLLARSTARTQELAIRTALGATRVRVIRQLLTECLLLALAGGGLGILLASWGLQGALKMLPQALPRAAQIHIDGRVLWVMLTVSALAGILFGLTPALKGSQCDLQETLKEGGRGASGSRLRTQRVFVAAELALAVVLLTGAGLTIRSLSRLWRVDLGFDPHNLLTFDVSPPPVNSPDAIRTNWREIQNALAALPGVQAAALTMASRPMEGNSSSQFWLDSEPKPATQAEMKYTLLYIVQPSYLAAMGTPLKRGRFLTEQDNEHAPAVMVIDERFAEEYFRGQDPLGKHVNLVGEDINAEIVGIVGHVKQWGVTEGVTLPIEAECYLAAVQLPDRHISEFARLVRATLRTRGPAPTVSALQRAVSQINPQQLIYDAHTMEETISSDLGERRFLAILIGIFAALALVMSCVGVYGVISYLASQRTHEIGVRMALGAERRDVLRMVVGEGAKMATIGIAFGLVAALGLTRLMAKLLFGISAHDPLTLVGVAALLGFVALAACYIPARRATKVDPMVALRYE